MQYVAADKINASVLIRILQVLKVKIRIIRILTSFVTSLMFLYASVVCDFGFETETNSETPAKSGKSE